MNSIDTVTVHYHRPLGDYDGWELWTWKEPDLDSFLVYAAERDHFGLVFHVRFGVLPEGSRVGLLPRKMNWDAKDPPDRFWSGALGPEVWIVSGRRELFGSEPDTSPFVVGAWIDSPSTVSAWLSVPLPSSGLSPDLFSIEPPLDGGREVRIVQVRPGSDPEGSTGLGLLEAELTLGRPLDLDTDNVWEMLLRVKGYRPGRLMPGRILDSPAFTSDAVMGAVCTEASTHFRVFAPTASELKVNLYRAPEGGVPDRHPMKRGSRGLWELTVPGDLLGRYYTLTAAGLDPRFDPRRELIDPCSRCNTAHNGRALLIRDTTPVADPPEFPAGDTIIYEVHIRDLTISPDSGVREKGKYLGLTETGTRLPSDPEITTGLDHLVELGVNAIQILPLQDFENDETANVYNWGYMPVHFNSPDGWYATRVADSSRVVELKRMIDALHRSGLKVILDVVYNHTAELPPKRIYSFEGLVPGYYYRLRRDGTLWDGSGTGNEFRSEAPMARKFILDSLAYWVTEYRIDGFRFDLMGLIDEETMDLVVSRLRALNPAILVYGEPWTGGPTPVHGPRKGSQRGRGFGVFNDEFRDAVKGGVFGSASGYVQDGSRVPFIRTGLRGSIESFAGDPLESVNYVECHDNQTLWDRLVLTSGNRPGGTDSDLRRMHLLASGLVLLAQGLPFLHAGQEMLRTKAGSGNSYRAPDEVNRITWSRKKEFSMVFAWFRDLIRIRKEHPMFRLGSASSVRSQFFWLDEDLRLPLPHSVVGFQLRRGPLPDPWESAVVLFHPGEGPVTVPLPAGGWWIHVDGERASAGTPLHGEPVEGSIEIGDRSVLLLARRSES